MTTRSAFISCLLFFLIFIADLISATFPVPNYPGKVSKNNELHKFRIPRGAKLSSYLNESVEPCFDFYEFACGNWPNFHAASEDNPITSPMKNLESTVNKELQELLEEDVTHHDGQVGRKIKDFYKSCMDAEKASERVKQVFTEFVRKNLGMPVVQENWDEKHYNWLIQVSNLRKLYDIDTLIGLSIKPDLQNRQMGRVHIGEPSTMIPKSVCKEADYRNSIFEELETQITDNMAFWFDLDKSKGSKLASDLLTFETTLCRNMSEELSPDEFPNVTRSTLPELNNRFKGIDLSYFTTTGMGQPIKGPVYLQDEPYLYHLSKIVRSTPKQTIANYVMYRALLAISFSEESDFDKRAGLCVEKCMKHFSKLLGDMYNRKKFDMEIKDDVEQLWQKLKEAFKADIRSQEWIEENTRRQAIYKIDAMQLRFADYAKDVLHSEYEDVLIRKGLFWENILMLLEKEQEKETRKLSYNSAGPRFTEAGEVEAFSIDVGYSPIQNIIRMPWGLLQPQVYHQTAPNSYKYGVLGFFLARQMIHGFDEIGWTFDENANMRLWWTVNSTLEYKERASCFREQYTAYAGEESDLSPMELDEKIREVIAGNGALNVTFNAYLQWLQRTDDLNVLYDETLSGVDYTNTQLFFIAFAQNFCTSTFSSEERIGFFPWDVSNYMEKFQVNGLLWNMKEFSREFNCAPGTEMNPGDKCVIY